MSRENETSESRPHYPVNTQVPTHMPPPYYSYPAPAYAHGPPAPTANTPRMDEKAPHPSAWSPYAPAPSATPQAQPGPGIPTYPPSNTDSAAAQAENAPRHGQAGSGGPPPQNNGNNMASPYPPQPPPQGQHNSEAPAPYPAAPMPDWRMSAPHPPPYGAHASAPMAHGMMGPPRDAPPHSLYTHWHPHHHHHAAAAYAYWNAPPQPPPRQSHPAAVSSAGAAPSPVAAAVPSPAQEPQPIAPKPYEQAQFNSPPTDTYDGRARATSPSQIENHHRDEIQNMGCTCKKTRCLKLYCQCFAAKLYCGQNCRCLTCANSATFEKTRREAMQSILLRNPSAFDTKFKKTASVEGSPEATTDPSQTGSRVLTHKLGCKCRKSGCMKKYCECYAGNVKCSSNCRCMGCKNMGTSPGGTAFDLDRKVPIAPSPAARSTYRTGGGASPRVRGVATGQTSRAPDGEPWVAAQNLTFMKHGSPEKKKTKTAEGDMPSLASSSDGTSPGERAHSNDDGANALMMAAVAMTEFGQSTLSSHRKRPHNEGTQSKSEEESSPPAKKKLPWDDIKTANV